MVSNDDPMVTTGEAAQRLGVTAATIQRWVDGGVLHAERTPGGHRRIPVAELRRLIASTRPAELKGPVAGWLAALLQGETLSLRSALLAARQRSGSWAELADEVASAVAELGRHWEAGACLVFEEHAASEALRRAIAMCAGAIARPENARSAAVFSVAGERHTLGLSLAELVFAEAGWEVFWLGEGPPLEEIGVLIDKKRPDLLVVSASPACPATAVARYQDGLLRAAKRARISVLLGGGGHWRPTRQARRVVTFAELDFFLARFGRPSRRKSAG